MKISFLSGFSDYTGCKEIELDGDYATVKELLDALILKYGDSFRKAVLQDGELSPDVIILVNGGNIISRQGLDTMLTGDEEITFFPALIGG